MIILSFIIGLKKTQHTKIVQNRVGCANYDYRTALYEIIANATGYTSEEVNEFNILFDTFCPSGQLYEEANAIKILTEKCHLSDADAKAFLLSL